MKDMINRINIEGLLHSVDRLKIATSQDGANYISGTLNIQVDDVEVVPVKFYVYEFYPAGGKRAKPELNRNYGILNTIATSPNVLLNGIEEAIKVRANGALRVNDWADERTKAVISSLENSCGFFKILRDQDEFKPGATFDVDVLITSCTDELDREGLPTENLIVQGWGFSYDKKVIPLRLVATSKDAVRYFRSLEPNTFTKVWGDIVFQTIKTSKVEKSAFGPDKIIENVSSRKSLVIAGVKEEPYAFSSDDSLNSESILTMAEVHKAVADRNLMLDTKTTEAKAPAAIAPTQPSPFLKASPYKF